MSARGDARKRQAEESVDRARLIDALATQTRQKCIADLELAEIRAELHAARAQIDRVREVAQEWHRRADAAREHGNPPPWSATRHVARKILRALDGAQS